jgi:hypothetical protein
MNWAANRSRDIRIDLWHTLKGLLLPLLVFTLLLAVGGWLTGLLHRPPFLRPTYGFADSQLDAPSFPPDPKNPEPQLRHTCRKAKPVTAVTLVLSNCDDAFPAHGGRADRPSLFPWTPDSIQNSPQLGSIANQQVSDPGGISIFTALGQQLGLKLDPRVEAAERLLVARAELPSAN